MFQVLSPTKNTKNQTSNYLAMVELKHARERVDFTSQALRIGWNGALELAQKKFGKREKLTLGECKELLAEIKRRGWKEERG